MSDELLAQVREYFDYDPETGILRWRKRPSRGGRAKAGNVAGCRDTCGYVFTHLYGKPLLAHRIAWLIVHGVMPDGQIDHINGIKDDNRIVNLRAVTPSENLHSIFKAQSNSKTGLRGVSRNGRGYAAQIKVSGKQTYLGTFKSAEQAHAAYLEAKAKFHPASAISKPFLVEGATK